MTVNFPDIDWELSQSFYGYPALQWQGWARGEIYIKSQQTKTLVLNTEAVLEYWIDNVHYFGGDYYGFRRAPVTLHLDPGTHRIDVRLIRDIRMLGGIGEPIVEFALELEESRPSLDALFDSKRLLMADVVDGDYAQFVSPYASVTIRNDGTNDMYVHDIEGMHNKCVCELISDKPIKLVPGQTRPIGFRAGCIPILDTRLNFNLRYRIDGHDSEALMSISTWPKVFKGKDETHKMTFLHSAGMVSYAMLRAPSMKSCGQHINGSLPIILALHGAGAPADSSAVKYSFDPLPDLCAWVLFPAGTTPWSGDDWHYWGFAEVEAAVAEIPKWIERVEWGGPGVDVNKWLVAGHSNGGQGVWYALTHRPDTIIAAAALSGFSSIESYVPYTFWHTVEPAKEVIVQAALSNYHHGLMLENAKGIPIFQQHGSLDDNVPAYQSRFLSQRVQQAGAESTYLEVAGAGHFWDGVVTTKPLAEFYERQLERHTAGELDSPINVEKFEIVVANPGDMGPKNGVEILQLVQPERLGRMQVTFEHMTGGCLFTPFNILRFRLNSFDNCDWVSIDGQKIYTSSDTPKHRAFVKDQTVWSAWDETTTDFSWRDFRSGRQLGALDAILRSNGTFMIVRHSKEAAHIALQISRNLCQYYAADTEIVDDYEQAVSATGNVISVATGSNHPFSKGDRFPIDVAYGVSIRDREGEGYWVYSPDKGAGVAAIYLRPLPDERLELVVWGSDEEALDVAARLVPMMTGSGQPDFVVADKTMLWKGLEGTLALGMFDSYWNVTNMGFFSY